MVWDSTQQSATTIGRLLASLDTDDSTLVGQMLSDAEVMFLNVTGLSETPDAAEPLLRKLVTAAYNKLGSEGLGGESYSGISQEFLDDLSKDVKRELYGFRKMRF